MSSNHPLAPPSRWLLAHEDRVREAHPLGPVIDLASGRGRHAIHLAQQGIPSIALDRNPDHLRQLAVHAARVRTPVQPMRCDLETPCGIPLQTSSCGAILVFRFLYRPLAQAIMQALKPGGILLYETFTLAHRATGRGPRRAAFYLAAQELRELFSGLELIHYEEGGNGDDHVEFTARLVARKPR